MYFTISIRASRYVMSWFAISKRAWNDTRFGQDPDYRGFAEGFSDQRLVTFHIGLHL